MIWKIVTLVVMLLAATTTSGVAAYVREYTPGGSPCNGVCTYAWALEQTKAPTGETQHVVVPKGSHVLWMSYGKEGKPYGTTTPMVFAQDEPGIGYWFKRGNLWVMLAKLDSCQNWTLIIPPTEAVSGSAAAVEDPTPVWNPGPPVDWVTELPRPIIPNPPPDPTPPPPPPVPPPSPVPAPPAVLMLVSALMALAFWRKLI